MDARELRMNFEMLGDWEDRYRYIIDLGRKLPSMDAADKTAETKIPGCQSNVWVRARVGDEDPPLLHLSADSDSQIVKGLVAIIIALCDGRTPGEVAELDIQGFFEEMELSRHLSMNRSIGLREMIQTIQATARRHRQNAD